MAWTISAFDGLKTGGVPSNLRVAMFELCRAINERQGAMNRAKTQFFKADGTEGADLTISDFENLKYSGYDSLAEQNLRRMQTAVKGLFGLKGAGGDGISFPNTRWLPSLVTSMNSSTILTLSSVETSIGGAFLSDFDRIPTAEWWQQMRDALNLARFWESSGRDRFTVGTGGGIGNEDCSSYELVNTNPADPPVPESVWDSRFTDTQLISDGPPSSTSYWLWRNLPSGTGDGFVGAQNRGASFSIDCYQSGGGVTRGISGQHTSTPGISLDLSVYSGTLGNLFYDFAYRIDDGFSEAMSTAFNIYVNAEEIPVSEIVSTNPGFDLSTLRQTTQFTTFASHPFAVEIGAIDDLPFYTETSSPFPQSFGAFWIGIYYVKFYGDMTPVLTDQD